MVGSTFIKRFIHRKTLFKIYLDLEMVFYELDFGKLNTNFVFEEADFYNNQFEGVPTFLKLEKSNKTTYEFIPDIDVSRLQKNQKYCIIEFKHLSSFSTKAVLTKSCLKFSRIEFKRYKHQ